MGFLISNSSKLGNPMRFIKYYLQKNSYHLEDKMRNVNISKWIKQVQKNTRISTEHLTPQIPLHLITKECEIYHQNHEESSQEFVNDPFWGFYWPGGQAVSKYILENPSKFRGKTVLDVGSGCGASAIAAKIVGAKLAIANDIDEVAGIAANLNAQINNCAIDINMTNLIGSTLKIKCDTILIGDLCYDSEFSNQLFSWLLSLKSKKRDIIVGDPGRHGLTPEFLQHLELLASYELPENCCIENHGFKNVYVYKFK